MAEIINLRRARKDRQRQAADVLAAENRARHGRTRAERQRDRTEAERLDRTVNAARREPVSPTDETA